jgi:hypothetical protein
MKQIILFLTFTSFLFGQDVEDGQVDQTPPSTLSEAPPKKNSTERRNWLFAAGSAAAASIAIILVWINPGAAPPSTTR